MVRGGGRGRRDLNLLYGTDVRLESSRPYLFVFSANLLICTYSYFLFAFVYYYEGFMTIYILHGPSMLAIKAKIYGVLYKQYSSIAFGETSSY